MAEKSYEIFRGLYWWEPVQLAPFTLNKSCVTICRLVTTLAKTLVALCYCEKSSDPQLRSSLPCFRSRLVSLSEYWWLRRLFHSRKINEADSLWSQTADKTVKATETMLGLQAVILVKIKNSSWFPRNNASRQHMIWYTCTGCYVL